MEDIAGLEIGFAIHNMLGTRFSHFMGEWEGLPVKFKKGDHVISCEIPQLFCLPGIYGMTPWIKRRGGGEDDHVDFAAEITVIGSDITGHSPDLDRYPNLGIYQKSNWKIEN
jgi:hypothetical protein